VRLRGEPDEVMLEVHNEGPPIREELLEAIFDPFRRGKLAGSGLGLGLYITREIVDAHGGQIEVQSTPDCGTTFAIRLPRSMPAGPRRPVETHGPELH